MQWILYTSLMFLSSIGFYALIRYGKELAIETRYINFVAYVVPAFLLLPILSYTRPAWQIQWQVIIAIIIAAFAFNFLGTYFSLRGMQTAPNPGFSLIIQKSYGALTVFIAPVIFYATITPVKVIATLCIILFAGLILLEQDKPILHEDHTWIAYSVITFFCYGFLSLFSKYMLAHGVPLFLFMFTIFSTTTICAFIHMRMHPAPIALNKKVLLTMLGIGLGSFLFNFFLNISYLTAPNIGYVNAINAGSVAALTLVSAWIFHDQLTIRKLIGVGGVTLGLMTLFLL